MRSHSVTGHLTQVNTPRLNPNQTGWDLIVLPQRDCRLTLRSATITRLSEPFASTAFAKRAFCCSAPATWNSLPRTVTDNDSLGTFNYRLKTFLFSLPFNWHWHYPTPAPLKLWRNGAIQIYYYYYYCGSLSWPRWLVTYQNGLAVHRWSPI